MGGMLTAQGMGGSGGGGAIRSLYLDWSDINTSGYDTVPGRLYAGVVPEIQSELQYNRTLGIAATRMDFVGHSMGGVIVKWYASDLGNLGWGRRNNFPAAFWSGTTFQYKRNNNFGVGDVRRLISVGSPFRGSPLADAVSNTLGFNQFRTNLLNITGLVNGDTCAADDLGMSSTATAILSGAHPAVSWFPIVGFGAPNLTEVALFNGNQCLYTLARALGITPGQIAPLGLLPCNSDFVVDQWSQVDRPLNGASPVHWGQACSVTHLQEMTNPLVANYIVGALDLYFNSPTAPGYQAGYNTFNSSF
jgi:pimeloyl-ACP methyl ester carboxylesterase